MPEVEVQDDYSLPKNYDDNNITLMARDPHWLFAYWEFSDKRKTDFLQQFGEDLWNKSVPFIKVTNVSKNTSFFVRINDFSNNWYINVPDPNCQYVAELGRKTTSQFFLSFASSNCVSTPGDSISSNNGAYFINYKDLRKDKPDLESEKIYETIDVKSDSKSAFGFGSQELFGISFNESLFGVSSESMIK